MSGIDVRYQRIDGRSELDELVATGASVHLEKIGDSTFCLIVDTETERVCLLIGAKRAPVDGWEMWRENR